MTSHRRAALTGLAILSALVVPAAAQAAAPFAAAPLDCLSNAKLSGCTASSGKLDGATSVAVSPDGRSAYVASGTGGTLLTLTRDSAVGALTPAGCFSTKAKRGCTTLAGRLDGAVSIAVDPSGSQVYVASLLSDTITQFTRRKADGKLTPSACYSNAALGSCSVIPGLLDFVGSVAVSADGRNLYSASLNSAAVVAFARDRATGRLTKVGCSTDEPVSGCTTVPGQLDGAASVTVAPGGAAAYVASFGTGAVVDFARDPGSGALTARQCFSTSAVPGCTTLPGQLEGETAVAVSADGSSVYATSPLSDALTAFAASTSTGALTPQACYSNAQLGSCQVVAGRLDGASAVATSRDGSSTYVASGDAGTITTFSRSNGMLAPDGCFSTRPSSGCTKLQGRLADASSVAVSPDGSNLYATSSKSDAVVSFVRAVPARAGVIRARQALRRVTLRRGRRAVVSYFADKAGKAKLVLRLGSKTVRTTASRSGTIGRNSIVLGSSMTAKLTPGRYTLQLVVAAPSLRAVKDSVVLQLKR